MRIQRTSFARNLPACQLANDNLLYGHLASHPYYGCAFVFVETLAHHKNLNFRTADTACAVRCILARFEPERLDIAFGGATAEVDDDMLWQINNYFDGVAADNMTVIFAQSARLQESIEELWSIANSLYAAIKGENPVGAPPLVWPSFRNLGFIAATLLNRSRLPKTADNILDLMIRAVLRGVHNPADDNDLEEIGALGTSLDLILEDQAAAQHSHTGDFMSLTSALHPDELPPHDLPPQVAGKVEELLLTLTHIHGAGMDDRTKTFLMDLMAEKLTPAQRAGRASIYLDASLIGQADRMVKDALGTDRPRNIFDANFDPAKELTRIFHPSSTRAALVSRPGTRGVLR